MKENKIPMPCPFCGKIPAVQPWHGGGPRKHVVNCDNEECDASPIVPGNTETIAIRRWNKRPTIQHQFNRDERANIEHALCHLEANKIADASAYGGWYCGNKEQFIKRHVKSIALMRSLLNKKEE